MRNFDPANPPEENLTRFQSKSIEMYQKLLNRGEKEQAEELRSLDSPSTQARFARQEVVEFDPEYDEDVSTSARIGVKNVYDGLLELGHDDLAADLRTHIGLTGQRQRAGEIIKEIDDEIDPVTGEVVPAEPAD